MEGLRPERNWRERATVLPQAPPRVSALAREVESLHGPHVARLVLHAYKVYGERVAVMLAHRLLRTRPSELLRTLTALAYSLPASDADPVIDVVSEIYAWYVIESVGGKVCEEGRARAKLLAARLLRMGYLVPVTCIAEYVRWRYCGGRAMSNRCAAYEDVLTGVER